MMKKNQRVGLLPIVGSILTNVDIESIENNNENFHLKFILNSH